VPPELTGAVACASMPSSGARAFKQTTLEDHFSASPPAPPPAEHAISAETSAFFGQQAAIARQTAAHFGQLSSSLQEANDIVNGLAASGSRMHAVAEKLKTIAGS